MWTSVLSSCHVHRRTGPMFKIGNKIVESLSLMPSSDEMVKRDFKRKRPAFFDNTAQTATSCNCTRRKMCDCHGIEYCKFDGIPKYSQIG